MYPTRWDRLDTLAMVANREPVKTGHVLQGREPRGRRVHLFSLLWVPGRIGLFSPCSSGPSSLDILEVSTGAVIV